MEYLMAMASHNPQQHQFYADQIDMKHFAPFVQPPQAVGLPQQIIMGNANMGLTPHPSFALQIPDPLKVTKPEHSFNKMQQSNPGFSPDCQYPLMSISAAALAQNLSINKKVDKNSTSDEGTTHFQNHREDPWINGAGNGTTSNGKKGTGKRLSESGSQKTKSQKMRVSANLIPSPLPQKEKPFECITCARRFTQRIGLLQHQRRHTGERPFGCKFCDKRFTQKSGLVQHERLHTNEKPFVCSFCDKAFTQKSGLNQHERTHTGEKPYICQLCGKCFTQQSGLKQHKKVHERSSGASK